MFWQGAGSDYINHVFDYTSVRPALTAFDVRPCFDHVEEMIHFMVQVDGKYTLNDVKQAKTPHFAAFFYPILTFLVNLLTNKHGNSINIWIFIVY